MQLFDSEMEIVVSYFEVNWSDECRLTHELHLRVLGVIIYQIDLYVGIYSILI